MNLTSFSFFVFLLITLVLYYAVKPAKKYILLVASIYFYISISQTNTLKLCILMFYISAITYAGALLIDYTSGKIRSIIFILSIVSMVMVLFIFKYAYNLAEVFKNLSGIHTGFSWLKFTNIIGISYYILCATGYIIDVYWGVYKAQKNIVNVVLFIFYFPQLISGPVTRYADMHKQFNSCPPLEYSNITNGLRRMAWGYFKKLVISERFGIIVSSVYGNYGNYSMIGIAGATLCYAVQLYTDFSGCMDIIGGTSVLFGIALPENFKAPFFSETIQEFWQRWHITLGLWFKDYLMYPLQKSLFLQSVGKWAKKKLGKRHGKKIPFYLAMLILWVLIGIWHGGTGYYFIASGILPCVMLMASSFIQPLSAKSVKLLKINTNCVSWHIFRRARTLFLICICWVFVCSGSTHNAFNIIYHMAAVPWKYTTIVNSFNAFGLNVMDMLLMVLGLVLLFYSDLCIYKGTTIFKKIDEQNLGFRVIAIYVEIMLVLFYGMVGSSSFIYFQF